MRLKYAIALTLVCMVCIGLVGCKEVESVSGTKMATVGKVQKNTEGRTVEQQNIYDRIKEDNNPGAIKHLYVISPYSGQVIIYSTVRGKVTSSHKRLTPSKVIGDSTAFSLQIGDETFYTDEILGEDGTFGDSAEYIHWYDSKGVYHQHFLTGGQIIHVSNEPLVVKGVIINMELSQKK